MSRCPLAKDRRAFRTSASARIGTSCSARPRARRATCPADLRSVNDELHPFGTLGDRFGDLTSALATRPDEPLARFDPPVDRAISSASDVARTLASAKRLTHVTSVFGSGIGLVARAVAKEGLKP